MSQAPMSSGGRRAPVAVHLEGISAGYGDALILRDLHLVAPAGEMTAVVGASGSGKTTMLRVIAGFLRPSAGAVHIADRVVADGRTWVPPERRRVGIVPQEGALFPHLDVLGNVMFGLARGSRARAMEVLEWVGMEHRCDARPQELSGGQQQRVALARALAPDPEVIVMDEPFSALDAGLRSSVRSQVRDVLQMAGTTAILVTHDQDEALSMASQVAVMIDGGVAACGTPREIYGAPTTLPVARFIGELVELPAAVHSGMLECALGSWPRADAQDGVGTAAVRPENITVRPAVPGSTAPLGRVVSIESHGHDSLVQVRLDTATTLLSRVRGFTDLQVGDEVNVEAQTTPMWFAD